MASHIGQTIGNYRIESQLGVGGMGAVYQGVHLELGRAAAIKVMHPHLAIDPGFQARFRQEARAAASLTHPGIVQIYDFGHQDDLNYLVMELVPDGSLRGLLSRQAAGDDPLDLHVGIDAVRQSAEALGYAHRQGMVHRDVKPDNLLLRAVGSETLPALQVKVCDFGLARLAEGSVMTASGVMMGTPAYMSPEQCQGQPLDGRSDQYSLGIVLYQVATGRLPFEVKTPTDAAFQHVFTPPPPPREVAPVLPAGIEAAILRCLAKQPEERYPSMEELAAALRSVQEVSQLPTPPIGRPTLGAMTTIQPPAPATAPPVIPPAPSAASLPAAEPVALAAAPSVPAGPVATGGGGSGRRRLPLILGLLAAVVVVGIGAGLFFWLQGGGSNDDGAAAAADVTPQPSTITYTLAGRLQRTSTDDGATPEDISAQLDTQVPPAPDYWINISPDGQWLLIDTERGDPDCAGNACLVLLPSDLSTAASTAEVIRIDDQVVHPASFGAVASGADLIIVTNEGGPHQRDLWAIHRGDGGWSQMQLLTADSPYDWNDNPAISRDGGHIVFECGAQPYAATGTAICEVGTDGADFHVVITPDNSTMGLGDDGALHNPDYAPDGSIVFVTNGNGDQVWSVQTDAAPVQLLADMNNAASACVLPDGRLALLWVDWPDSTPTREMQVIEPQSSATTVILSVHDDIDTSMGCGS